MTDSTDSTVVNTTIRDIPDIPYRSSSLPNPAHEVRVETIEQRSHHKGGLISSVIRFLKKVPRQLGTTRHTRRMSGTQGRINISRENSSTRMHPERPELPPSYDFTDKADPSSQSPERPVLTSKRSFFFRKPKQVSPTVRPTKSFPALKNRISQHFQSTVIHRKHLRSALVIPSDEYIRLSSAHETEITPGENVNGLLTLDHPSLYNIMNNCQLAPSQQRTAELVAATKVYFETHFANIANSPNSRAMRQRSFENVMLQLSLSDEEREALRDQFLKNESDYLRMRRGKSNKLSVNDFSFIEDIGQGSFGEVKLVEGVKDSWKNGDKPQVYALKVIQKERMLRHNQEGHLRAERDFLVASQGTKWIVNMLASFQDEENLYLVMEYVIGGDFLSLLEHLKILTEDQTRFYAAEMVLAIEEAHSLHFIHRDIKPDNFVIDAGGHLKLCDFGLAYSGHWSHDASYFREQRELVLRSLSTKSRHEPEVAQAERTYSNKKFEERVSERREKRKRERMAKSFVGTNQYIAPEIIRGERYDGRCDWWSLGIIIYECLFGYTPFCEGSEQDIQYMILNWPRYLEFPPDIRVSNDAQDFLLRLLTEKHLRLSCGFYRENDQNKPSKPASFVHPNDAKEIKDHTFFKGVDWTTVSKVIPPHVPAPVTVEDLLARRVKKEVRVIAPTDGTVEDDDMEEGGLGAVTKDSIAPETADDFQPVNQKVLADGRQVDHLMELRKQKAFLGYTYRRPKTVSVNTRSLSNLMAISST